MTDALGLAGHPRHLPRLAGSCHSRKVVADRRLPRMTAVHDNVAEVAAAVAVVETDADTVVKTAADNAVEAAADNAVEAAAVSVVEHFSHRHYHSAILWQLS